MPAHHRNESLRMGVAVCEVGGLTDVGGSLCSPQADVPIPVIYCGGTGAHQPLPDVRGRGLGGPAPLAVSERQVGAVWKG